MKRKADFIFIGVLGLLLANTLIQFIVGNTVLTLNNYLGILFWLISIALRLTSHRYGRHVVAIMLLLGTLNLASFGIGNVSLSIGFGSLVSPGVNPILLLILIIYVFVKPA